VRLVFIMRKDYSVLHIFLLNDLPLSKANVRWIIIQLWEKQIFESSKIGIYSKSNNYSKNWINGWKQLWKSWDMSLVRRDLNKPKVLGGIMEFSFFFYFSYFYIWLLNYWMRKESKTCLTIIALCNKKKTCLSEFFPAKSFVVTQKNIPTWLVGLKR